MYPPSSILSGRGCHSTQRQEAVCNSSHRFAYARRGSITTSSSAAEPALSGPRNQYTLPVLPLEASGRTTADEANILTERLAMELEKIGLFIVTPQSTVVVTLDNGAPTAARSNAACKPAGGRINLITTYKPVTLALPASAAVQISARTQYGKISSDFPIYLNSDDNGKAVKMEVGAGGAVVRVETSGDIILRKE